MGQVDKGMGYKKWCVVFGVVCKVVAGAVWRSVVSILFQERRGARLARSVSPDRLMRRRVIGRLEEGCETGSSAPREHDAPVAYGAPVAIFSYKDPTIRALIWEMKYYNTRGAYHVFARCVARALRQHAPHEPTIYITNIPISTKRYKEKGFDHIDTLCKEIETYSNKTIVYFPLLVKTRHTKRQAHIHKRSDRLGNITGSFSIRDSISPETLPPHIWIIDDVYTTGATTREATSVITRAGVLHVYAMTIAH